MHQLIATMERDGLIERRPDEANRRILRAWLTGHGAEVLRSCHRVVDGLRGADALGAHPRRGGRVRAGAGAVPRGPHCRTAAGGASPVVTAEHGLTALLTRSSGIKLSRRPVITLASCRPAHVDEEVAHET